MLDSGCMWDHTLGSFSYLFTIEMVIRLLAFQVCNSLHTFSAQQNSLPSFVVYAFDVVSCVVACIPYNSGYFSWGKIFMDVNSVSPTTSIQIAG